MKLVGLMTSMFRRRHFYEVLPMDPVAWPLLLAAHREALRKSMAEQAVLSRIDPSTMQPPAAKASLSPPACSGVWLKSSGQRSQGPRRPLHSFKKHCVYKTQWLWLQDRRVVTTKDTNRVVTTKDTNV